MASLCLWEAGGRETVRGLAYASSDFHYNVTEQARISPFVAGVISTSAEPIQSVRWLSGVERGAEECKVGDVVLVEQMESAPMVMRLDQVLQVVYAVPTCRTDTQVTYTSRVRMWGSDAHVVSLELDGIARRDAHVSLRAEAV